MTDGRPSERPGALVISLDFEMHWGMRDHSDRASSAYAELAGSRRTVEELAALFVRRGVRATWATVGFLFASTGAELREAQPDRRPSYRLAELDPYDEPVGADEEADPEHLAGSLVGHLATSPGQEVASHTFSHYYCLEEGQNRADLRADLRAAQAIAGTRGLQLTSLVLPRNQWDPAYADVVLECGFTCIRGPQPSWGHRTPPPVPLEPVARMARLADTYGGVTPPPTADWNDVLLPDGLCDVPASAFLRPFAPERSALRALQWRRLRSGLRHAARQRKIFHLWWHPHNFTRHPAENFALLDRLLDEFERLRRSDGMQSLSMGDVAAQVGAGDRRDAPAGI